MESLWQQATALESALEDAANALGKNEGLRSLVRRTTELEAALASYETAFYCHEQVADASACAAAKSARRILEDSWEVAMDALEALAEVKADKEEVGAKVVVEVCVNEVELEFFAAEVEVVETCGAKDRTQMVDNKSLESVQTAEVEAWIAVKPLVDLGEHSAKVEVASASKDEVVGSGGLDLGENVVKSVEEVQVDIEVKQNLGGMLRDTKEELEFRAIRNKLQELRILESNHEDEFDAEFELQVPEFGVMRFLGWVSRSLAVTSEYG